MTNSLKRSLLSTAKPNKYSSGGSGSKKRPLNARPPQPASVSRLESILDGAMKKKKKKQKLEAGESNIKVNSSKRIDVNVKGSRNIPDSMRTALISKGGTFREAATGRRRVSDENNRNQAHGKTDRWSHVNSISKSRHRAKAVNPFLEMNQQERSAQNTKIRDAEMDVAKFAKPKKSSGGLSLSLAKKDRTKLIKSIQRKECCKEGERKNETNMNGIKTQLPASVDMSNQKQTCQNSKVLRNLNAHFEKDNQSTHDRSPSQPDFSSQEEDISNDFENKPTSSDEVQLSMQKESNQKAISPAVIQTPSIENSEEGTLLASSFRPKLGLRLGKKRTKGNLDSVSFSRFHSSRRVTSSPTTFRRSLPITDAEDGAKADELLVVLGSPGKSNSSLSLPQYSLKNSGDNFLASDRETASSGFSTLQSDVPIDDKTKRDASSGSNVTTARMNVSTINRNNANRKKANINDNFVRLNMKNKAGACRGAKNKSSKYSKEKRTWTFRGGAANYEGGNPYDHAPMGSYANPALTLDPPLPPTSLSLTTHNNMQNAEDLGDEGRGGRFSRSKDFNNSKTTVTSYVSKMSGLDPLDEFVDGTFHSVGTKNGKPNTKQATSATVTSYGGTMTAEAPKCARHQRPCKLIKVKKATTGNKGREFYACSMPRGEQCDHFQWADDTVESARCTIIKNSSYSSFITRQVAAYVDRFRTLTVPELKEETFRRGLNKNGKKQQLLMRLAIWTRDEIAKCSPELANEEREGESETNDRKITSFVCGNIQDDEDSDGDCSSYSSEEELELFYGAEETEQDDLVDIDDEEMSFDADNRYAIANIRSVEGEKSLSGSLQEIFGHAAFRDGQEWAIQRCLDEKSSLLVAPTGFGKSLCYALPAALMDGVCIVVSPLISLIQDQLRSLPPRVPAATLSGSVSASKTAAIIDDIVRKRLKILFVSPERLTSPAFRRLFNLTWNPETNTRERKFPEISLLCIDEAHCISQWAHNFRPCFLRFKGFLKIMQPKSILAITATAGPRVIRDIGQTLGMDFPESITEESQETALDTKHESIKIIHSGRDNIDVMGKFISNHEEQLAVVAGILTPGSDKNNPYAGKLARGSTIVYVWRQRDTEVVAESLKAAGVCGGVVVYHGGMDASSRAKAQNKFMRGKARICVATIAFGLGIDKADIVGIVHLYLSNSPEHYLQEIGRAGRDGRSATAIALPLLEEVPTRHSLAFSNLVSKSQIGALLRIIKRLVETAGKVCDMVNSRCGRFLHVALPIQSSVRACDCKPETIETFLSLIERIGGDSPLLHLEGYNYDSAAIAMKKRTLKKLAEREPIAVSIEAVSQCVDSPLSEAGAGAEKVNNSALPSSFQRQFLAYSKGSHSFSISQCANHLGPTAEPRHVFAALRRLQFSSELEFVLDTSEKGRIFQLKISEAGFELFNSEDYSKTEEYLVNTIFESFSSSSDSGATKLLDIHYLLDQVAQASDVASDIDPSEQFSSSTKSQSLLRFQELTGKYFGEGLESERLATEGLLPKSFSTIREKELKIDALSLLRDLPPLFQQYTSNSSHNQTSEKDLPPEYLKLGEACRIDYTALAISKFLHGMDTPRTPFLTFRQYPLFGKWKTVDFHLVHDFILRVMESRK